MRCPSCHQNIRIQGKFCPKCGEQIFGLPVRAPGGTPSFSVPSPPPLQVPQAPPPPPVFAPTPAPSPSAVVLDDDDFGVEDYPTAPPSGPVLDITLEDTPGGGGSTPADAVGKVCPYCRFPIKSGEAVQICPSCGEPHHLECWRENGGCTVYGCRSSPAMAGAAAPVGEPQSVAWPQPAGYTPAPGPSYGAYQQPGLPRDALALLEGELDRLATNALVFALLGFLGITAVIGLLVGISVLGQVYRSGIRAGPARGKAWAAIGLSSFWIIGLFSGLSALVRASGLV